jgi:hypothetical protein
VHEETLTFVYTNPPKDSKFALPIFLEDLTDLVDTYQPDLVRAQITLPFSTFDGDNNRFADNWWSAAFYDWQDRNTDGNLWKDENFNGQVDEGEIDIEAKTGLYEFNRFSSANPVSTYLETSLGSQGLSQQHDGILSGFALSLLRSFSHYSGSGNLLSAGGMGLVVPFNR